LSVRRSGGSGSTSTNGCGDIQNKARPKDRFSDQRLQPCFSSHSLSYPLWQGDRDWSLFFYVFLFYSSRSFPSPPWPSLHVPANRKQNHYEARTPLMAVTPLLVNYVAPNAIHLLDNSPFPVTDPLSLLLVTPQASGPSLWATIMPASRQPNARCPETDKGLSTGC
jgi:hypothetical protein